MRRGLNHYVEVHLFFFFFAILPFGEKNPELKSPKEHLQSIQTEKKTHDSEKEINNKRFQKTHTTFSSKKLFMFWGSNTFCEFSIFFFPLRIRGFRASIDAVSGWHTMTWCAVPREGRCLGGLEGGVEVTGCFSYQILVDDDDEKDDDEKMAASIIIYRW